MASRPSWDEYFIQVAHAASKRATCPLLSVGAVVVKDNQVISTGYNGAAGGEPHCTDVGCLRDARGSCLRALHAERNALLRLTPDEASGATLYCTHSPCPRCSETAISLKIGRIVYDEKYNSTASDNAGSWAISLEEVNVRT